MSKFLGQASAGVLSVAVVKTALTVQFVLPAEQADVAMISGLFAVFTGLTAGVAYVAFTKIRAMFETNRQERLELGGEAGATKESVIDHHGALWGLSQAEKDVALFVAKGLSNSEIADVRGCAIATVKSQLGAIYAKSGLETRYQLMAFVADEVCEIAQEQGMPMRGASSVVQEANGSRKLLDFATAKLAQMPEVVDQSRAVGQ